MPDAAVMIIFGALSGFEVIRFFAVLRDVQAFDLLRLTHAHAGNHIRYFQEHNGADERKAPGNQYAYKLVAELSPVTVHSAYGFTRAENRIDHLLREDAGEERADGAARAVNAESIESIIIAEDRFYFCHHVVADQACDKADCESGHWSHESCRWCDCHEPCNRSGDCAESARAAVLDPLRDAPAHCRCSGGHVRGHKCARRQGACCQRATCVKAEPADPQETRANKA